MGPALLHRPARLQALLSEAEQGEAMTHPAVLRLAVENKLRAVRFDSTVPPYQRQEFVVPQYDINPADKELCLELMNDYRHLWHNQHCKCQEEGEEFTCGQEHCTVLPCGCVADTCIHDDRDGSLMYMGWKCQCGCGQVLRCPSEDLCFMRILHLPGREQTKAVKKWMSLGLCVCELVLAAEWSRHRNKYASGVGFVYRNWRASRRRKLVQCPCEAYFANDIVRGLGLLSESEWKRLGYAKLMPGEKYPVRDPHHFHFFGGQYRRTGPPPRGRVWRPFYEPRSKRFEGGVHSVDLFSAADINRAAFLMTSEQCLKNLDRFFSNKEDRP
jgi:hypothetical protein